MARPKVTVAITNGNLNLQGPSENGVSVLIVAAPVAPVAGYGTAFTVKSAAEVITAFGQVGNAPVVAAINNGFFAEAPEGTKLHVLAMAQATPFATLALAANAEKALMLAGGAARLVGLIKFPSAAYAPIITAGFDADVDAAVIAMETLANVWQLKNQGFRFFVEGYGFTNATDAKNYELASYRHGAIVVGTVDASTAIATMLCLGRAAKAQPQQNIGRVKTGSLNIAETALVKIGATLAELVAIADLETLHNKRYITFEKNAIASGYIFNDDNMLTQITDDYNNLRHGRVIDNGQRVAFKTYYEELKDDVDVDDNGRMVSVIEKALETKIEVEIDKAMRAQLSKKKDGSADLICMVNPDVVKYVALYNRNNIVPNFNLIQSNTVYIFLLLKPKGCLKYINVYLGLTATS